MKTEMLADLDARIEKLTAMRAFVETMPELAVPAENKSGWFTAHEDYVGINLPYDHSLIAKNKDIMLGAGFKMVCEVTLTDDGTLHLGFRKGDYRSPNIDFFFRPKLVGSTCKLNVIGYENRPIYEVTCLEA